MNIFFSTLPLQVSAPHRHFLQRNGLFNTGMVGNLSVASVRYSYGSTSDFRADYISRTEETKSADIHSANVGAFTQDKGAGTAWVEIENCSVICTTTPSGARSSRSLLSSSRLAAQYLAESYMHLLSVSPATKSSPDYNDDTNFSPSEYSCVLYDSIANVLLMQSDAAGVVPLWYSFDYKPLSREKEDGQDGEHATSNFPFKIPFMVTSDLVGATLTYGFNDFSYVSYGSTLSIDCHSGVILDAYHHMSQTRHAQLRSASRLKSSLEAYAKPLLQQGLSSVKKSIHSKPWGAVSATGSKTTGVATGSTVILDIDQMDPAGLLLQCVLHRLKAIIGVFELRKKRTIKNITQPSSFGVRSDASFISTGDDLFFESIVSNFTQRLAQSTGHNSKQQAMDAAVSRNIDSIKEMAIDRWNSCKLAASFKIAHSNADNISSDGDNIFLFASDTGLFATTNTVNGISPLYTYFQNAFCAHWGVEVQYPFRNNHFQSALWAAENPKSYFTQAVELLTNMKLCSNGNNNNNNRTNENNNNDHNNNNNHHSSDDEMNGWFVSEHNDESTPRSSSSSNNNDINNSKRNSVGSSSAPPPSPITHYASAGLHTLLDGNAANSNDASISNKRVSARPIAGLDVKESHDVYIMDNSGTFPPTSGIGTESTAQDRFTDLPLIATERAHGSGVIVLLSVTSGYLSLLSNFFHSTRAHGVQFKYFLIVTSSMDVCALADKAGVGCYLAPLSPPMRNSNDNSSTAKKFSNSHEFGTLSYQELILTRTQAALELLLWGFHPIIADIDTVWLRDPLKLLLYGNNDDTDDDDTAGRKERDVTHSGSFQRYLQQKQQEPFYDLAITDDDGEVCGCFVVLRSTNNGILFWQEVVKRHEFLVKNATTIGGGTLDKFTDSEQKILTQLIYKGEYANMSPPSVGLRVWKLPAKSFPSGYRYFNLRAHGFDRHSNRDRTSHSHSNSNLQNGNEMKNERRNASNNEEPIVIHNNFLIGKEMKQARFQRYGLWRQSGQKHEYDDWEIALRPLQMYREILPSLTIVQPIHNTVTNSTRLLVQVSKEDTVKGGLRVHYEADPPSHLDFENSGIFELNIEQIGGAICALTAKVKDSNIEVSVDVAVGRQSFASDRGGKYVYEANEYVLRTIRQEAMDKIDAEKTSLTSEGSSSVAAAAASTTSVRDSYLNDYDDRSTAHHSVDMAYHIKVLTYNRPDSLLRLLTSLGEALYLPGVNVSLEIIIDGNRTNDTKEIAAIARTYAIASSFSWSQYTSNTTSSGASSKTVVVTSRTRNFGLAGQWYHAWQPRGEYEAAFIFEDDVEVSPYYFIWATAAVRKYYASDELRARQQRNMHWKMLRSVREHIRTNGSIFVQQTAGENRSGSNSNSNSRNSSKGRHFDSHIDNFVYLTAGVPLMYGICLQKQHLDPYRYPKKLRLRTGHNSPYLFSLLGSWGPLMLPLPWQAFREWWVWRSAMARQQQQQKQQNQNQNQTDLKFNTSTSSSKSSSSGVLSEEEEIAVIGSQQQVYEPLTDHIIVDFFYKSNPRIWTPWHVRFAYETGMKCLYSNLPGSYSLVINHREPGENYKGSSAHGAMGSKVLLPTRQLERSSSSSSSSNCSSSSSSSRTEKDNIAVVLRDPALSLPSWSHLLRWQFDLNLRRCGSFGSDRAYFADESFVDKSSYGGGDTTITGTDEFEKALLSRSSDLLWADNLIRHRIIHEMTASSPTKFNRNSVVTVSKRFSESSLVFSHMSLRRRIDILNSVQEMVTGILPTHGTITVHIGASPILPLLLHGFESYPEQSNLHASLPRTASHFFLFEKYVDHEDRTAEYQYLSPESICEGALYVPSNTVEPTDSETIRQDTACGSSADQCSFPPMESVITSKASDGSLQCVEVHSLYRNSSVSQSSDSNSTCDSNDLGDMSRFLVGEIEEGSNILLAVVDLKNFKTAFSAASIAPVAQRAPLALWNDLPPFEYILVTVHSSFSCHTAPTSFVLLQLCTASSGSGSGSSSSVTGSVSNCLFTYNVVGDVCSVTSEMETESETDSDSEFGNQDVEIKKRWSEGAVLYRRAKGTAENGEYGEAASTSTPPRTGRTLYATSRRQGEDGFIITRSVQEYVTEPNTL